MPFSRAPNNCATIPQTPSATIRDAEESNDGGSGSVVLRAGLDFAALPPRRHREFSFRVAPRNRKQYERHHRPLAKLPMLAIVDTRKKSGATLALVHLPWILPVQKPRS